MLALGNITRVDPLHPALLHRFELFKCIQMTCGRLAVDLDFHGIKAQFCARGQRDKHGELRIRGVEKLLRITSYNVCYTKLLRLVPSWAMAAMGSAQRMTIRTTLLNIENSLACLRLLLF